MKKRHTKTEIESVAHSTVSGMRFFVADITYRGMHVHSDMEIIQIISGSLHIKTKHSDFDLGEGEVALFNSHEAHSCYSNLQTPCCLLVLQINKAIFKPYYPNITNMVFLANDLAPVTPPDILAEIKRVCFNIGYNYFGQKPAFEFRCISDVSRLFGHFLVHLPHKVLSTNEYQSSVRFEQRMRRITDYIQEHYRENITLAEIAAREDLTVTYLSHFFKDHLDQSFQSYLNALRFEHALYLLQKTDHKIIDICMESGFSDSKYLNNMFQKTYHMTPNAYRKAKPDTPARELGAPEHLSTNEYIYPIEGAIAVLRKNHRFQCDIGLHPNTIT